MKQSYFSTPRTLGDATFHTWADPIEREPSGESGSLADIALLVVLVIGIITWRIWL